MGEEVVRMIDNIKTINEFNNDGVVYGIYEVEFKGKKETFVRNGNSIGVITFYLGGRVDECVSIVRGDVAEEFLKVWARR